MIINLIEPIKDIMNDNDNKSKSVEIIKKEIEDGLNAIYKCNDEVVYRIDENTYIKTYPLNELGNIFDEDDVRKTRDFNVIHKFNTLKQEHDKIINELRAEMNDETLALLNKYIELSENKPLFAIVMFRGDSFKPKILQENIGIYFNNIYKLLICYLSSLGVVIE